MVFRAVISFLLLLFVASCAQVGTISGGPVDETAPTIKKMNPENKSTNVSTNSIVLEFEDFVKLNKPAQTIQVIPPDFNVNASSKGKTVTLAWTEPMQENTTYSIFLNKTIQDITESNDSIMQLVFSTGNFIDSLSYTCFVKDIQTQAPSKKVLVGLFAAEDSLKPIYFSQTNERGEATFSYLKEGSYFVRAYNDIDNNLKISKNEPVGFKLDPVFINKPMMVDSIPLGLFQPQLAPKITTFLFQSPGSFILAANRSLKDATFRINDAQIKEENILRFAADSLLFCYNPGDLKTIQLITESENLSDTSNLRITTSKLNTFPILAPKGNKVNYNNYVEFSCPDEIREVDTSKIKIINQTDLSRLSNYGYSLQGNSIRFVLDKSKITTLNFDFDDKAFIGETEKSNQKASFAISVVKEKEVGSILLDLSQFSKPLILNVNLAGKKIKTHIINNDEIVTIADLEIGDYTFKVVEDKNANELWDTGDFTQKIFPESIYFFNETTKVRANWEISVSLVPIK